MLALGLAGVLPKAQASVPDWAKDVIAHDDPTFQPDKGAVALLDSIEYKFLAPDKASGTDGSGGMKIHERMLGVVKIRDEAHRSWEFADARYDPNTTKIVAANAWIVAPNGRKSDSFGRSEFLDTVAQYNSYFWDYQRVLRFVSSGKVDAGGYVVWAVELEMNSPFPDAEVQFRWAIPVLKHEFKVDPAPGTHIEFTGSHASLQAPTHGVDPGSLVWVLERQPAPAERMPNGFFANPMIVSVRCSSSAPSAVPCTWATISQTASSIMEPRVDPGGAEVNLQCKELLQGKAGRWDRIRALADFVQSNVVYLEITTDRDAVAGFRPHSPADVLKNRFGDCKDKATLLVSMLRSIGVESRVVLVTSGNPLAISQDWPSPNFNHAIVVIRGDGSEPQGWPRVDDVPGNPWIVFDPTNPSTPLGVLPTSDEGGLGLIVEPGGGRLVRLPVADPSSSRLSVVVNATMDSDDLLRASVVEDCYGLTAANFYGQRHDRTHEQYDDYILRRLHQAQPLSQDLKWADDWDPLQAHFHQKIDFSIPGFARHMPNGLLLFSPELLPGIPKFEAWGAHNDGFSVLGPDSAEKEVRVTIPEGYSVVELPDGYKKEGKLVSAEISFTTEGNTVVLKMKITRHAGVFGKADYDIIRADYRELHDAERRSVIVRKAPEASKS